MDTTVGRRSDRAVGDSDASKREPVFDSTVTGPMSVLKALRPHQWAKNALVFLPGVAAHRLLLFDAVIPCLLAFVAFSLCASAAYVFNDLSDVETDRQHPRKRYREIAAGRLGQATSLTTAFTLLAASFLVATVGVSWRLAAVLAFYLVATTAYTLWLKRVPVVDVFTLTGFYVLRIVAGGIATATSLSTWFLAFALFLLLSLAFVKRYVELTAVAGAPAREYGPDDAAWMQAIGTSAGYMAVVVLALYITAPEVRVLYTRPDVLWLLCPLLLFWLTRLWFRAGRRLVHDDPVVEVLRDPVGYVTLSLAAMILMAAAA